MEEARDQTNAAVSPSHCHFNLKSSLRIEPSTSLSTKFSRVVGEDIMLCCLSHPMVPWGLNGLRFASLSAN
jgi:hypothetical protein